MVKILYNNKIVKKQYTNGNVINKIPFQVEGSPTPPLPYDAEVEYLESDGASYIDTGIYLNTSNFEVGYEQVGVGTEKHWGYGHQGVASGAWVTVMHDIACFGQITNYVTISPYLTSGNNILKYTQSGITVNGTTLSKNLSLTGRDNLNTFAVPIFGWYDFNSRGIEYSQNYQLKSFYIKNNGTLVFDAIPVRVGQVGYMYDRVSGQLFGNQGSGDFTLGNDTGTPTPQKTTIYWQYADMGTPTTVYATLQELAQTHTVVQVATNRYTLEPTISGITFFRLNMNNYGNGYFIDLYRDNLAQTKYFGIKDDSNGSLYRAIDGYSTIKDAANSSSCTWAYWIDQNTIEVNVVDAVQDTVCLGNYYNSFSMSFISFPITS